MTRTPTQEFHLGDVLSVTTGKVLAPNGFSGTNRLIEYLVGRPVLTHEIPDFADRCREALVSLHPQLSDIETPPQWQGNPVSYDETERWVLDQADRLGSLWWPVPYHIVQL
jgi:hypothetical protein